MRILCKRKKDSKVYEALHELQEISLSSKIVYMDILLFSLIIGLFSIAFVPNFSWSIALVAVIYFVFRAFFKLISFILRIDSF